MTPRVDPRAYLQAALEETLRGHTEHWWTSRRPAWGYLTAAELADMGLFATLAYAVRDLVRTRNDQLRESKALWFDPKALTTSSRSECSTNDR